MDQSSKSRGRSVGKSKRTPTTTLPHKLTFLAINSPLSLCNTLFTVPPFPAPNSPTTFKSSSLSSGNPFDPVSDNDDGLPEDELGFFRVFLVVPLVPPPLPLALEEAGREVDEEEISMLAS